jgi:hypothetical protein
MQGIQSRHPPGGACVITGDQLRYTQAVKCITALQVPAGSSAPWMSGVLVAHNINLALKAVMDNPKLQWAWLMGDDHLFPPDILIKLLDRDVDCIVPLCLNRAPPMDPTIITADKKLKRIEDLPASGLYKLGPGETCGDAGILVRRHVLEATGPNWHELKKSGSHNAEDREFVQKVKDAGFDVHVDVDHPISHMAAFEIVPVRTEEGWVIRLNCANRHVCDLGAMRTE